jgi:hypothetical protein
MPMVDRSATKSGLPARMKTDKAHQHIQSENHQPDIPIFKYPKQDIFLLQYHIYEEEGSQGSKDNEEAL